MRWRSVSPAARTATSVHGVCSSVSRIATSLASKCVASSRRFGKTRCWRATRCASNMLPNMPAAPTTGKTRSAWTRGWPTWKWSTVNAKRKPLLPLGWHRMQSVKRCTATSWTCWKRDILLPVNIRRSPPTWAKRSWAAPRSWSWRAWSRAWMWKVLPLKKSISSSKTISSLSSRIMTQALTGRCWRLWWRS